MSERAIAVVGSGMVGSALALGLVARGLADRVEWIGGPVPEPAPQPGQDARVIACSPASRALLQDLGVWAELPPSRVCEYSRMRVWEQLGTAGLEFEPPGDDRALGWIVENALLNAQLAARVFSTQEKNRVELNSHLGRQVVAFETAGHSQQLQLDNGDWIQASLVLAADGAFSSLRALSGHTACERDTGQRSLVAVVDHSEPHQHCAWQNFLPSGPLAFLPLPAGEGRHACAIVWSLDRDVAAGVEALGTEAFLQRLQRFAPAQLGELVASTDRVGFDICQHRLASYGQPGLLFVGDAAHRVHPLAGQGANLGFADVDCLLRELSRNQQRGELLSGESLLRRYQRQRRWHNDLTLDAMTALQFAYGLNEPHWRVARNKAVQLIDSFAPAKRLLARGAMGELLRT